MKYNATKYLEQAYVEAQKYSEQIAGECEEINKNYIKNNRFYHETTAKEMTSMIVLLVLGVAGIFFRSKVYESFFSVLYSKWDFGVLMGYFPMIYILVCVLLIGLGAWKLFCRIYSQKTNQEVNKVNQLSERMKSELDTIKNNFDSVKEQIFRAPSKVVIDSKKQYENELLKYKNNAEKIGAKTNRANEIFLLILLAVVLLLHFQFLGKYAVAALSIRFDYPTVMVMSCSYILMFLIFYCFQSALFEYLNHKTRYVMLAAFGIYQLAMGTTLKANQLFLPWLDLNALQVTDVVEGDPQWQINIVSFCGKYLLSKGTLLLIFTSVIGLMYILKTDIEREMQRKVGQTVEVPMTDGTTRVTYTASASVASRVWQYIFAGAFVVIAPKFMAGILVNGLSIGSVFLYLVIGTIWFFIQAILSSDTNKQVYGKRLVWIKNGFFFAYMWLTLALVPGFGIGSIILLVLQSIITTVFWAVFLGGL